jgi:hypothetical protein
MNCVDELFYSIVKYALKGILLFLATFTFPYLGQNVILAGLFKVLIFAGVLIVFDAVIESRNYIRRN